MQVCGDCAVIQGSEDETREASDGRRQSDPVPRGEPDDPFDARAVRLGRARPVPLRVPGRGLYAAPCAPALGLRGDSPKWRLPRLARVHRRLRGAPPRRGPRSGCLPSQRYGRGGGTVVDGVVALGVATAGVVTSGTVTLGPVTAGTGTDGAATVDGGAGGAASVTPGSIALGGVGRAGAGVGTGLVVVCEPLVAPPVTVGAPVGAAGTDAGAAAPAAGVLTPAV